MPNSATDSPIIELPAVPTPALDRLTPPQKAFVLRWFNDPDRNVTAAYKAAGYACKNDNIAAVSGRTLLMSPKIQAAVFELYRAERLRIGLDPAWWVKEMVDGIERCKATKPLLDSEGNETGVFIWDASGFFSGMDKLGKHLGVYEKHNQQKLGPDSLEAIKERLRARGFPLEALEKAGEN